MLETKSACTELEGSGVVGVSEGMASQMRGSTIPVGAAERALQAGEIKCAKTQKLEWFCRIF